MKKIIMIGCVITLSLYSSEHGQEVEEASLSSAPTHSQDESLTEEERAAQLRVRDLQGGAQRGISVSGSAQSLNRKTTPREKVTSTVQATSGRGNGEAQELADQWRNTDEGDLKLPDLLQRLSDNGTNPNPVKKRSRWAVFIDKYLWSDYNYRLDVLEDLALLGKFPQDMKGKTQKSLKGNQWWKPDQSALSNVLNARKFFEKGEHEGYTKKVIDVWYNIAIAENKGTIVNKINGEYQNIFKQLQKLSLQNSGYRFSREHNFKVTYNNEGNVNIQVSSFEHGLSKVESELFNLLLGLSVDFTRTFEIEESAMRDFLNGKIKLQDLRKAMQFEPARKSK